jgi:hypothetical protein
VRHSRQSKAPRGKTTTKSARRSAKPVLVRRKPAASNLQTQNRMIRNMDAQPLTTFRKPAAAEPAGLNSLVRAVIARAAAVLDGGVRAADYAAATWPNDAAVPLILRAASVPTTMSSTALAPVVVQFATALRPLSAAGELMARGIALTNFGRGLVAVPSFAPGESEFVAEAAPIPVKQFVSSGPTLSPYKLATIAVMSGELLEHSEAETMVRAVLAESVGLGLDRVLFSANAAVPGKSPAGLLNGIAALTPAAAGGQKQDAMASDIQALIGAIAATAGSGWMLITAPAQAGALAFRLAQQVPNVITSGVLAAGTVIAIAPQAFVSIMEAPRIDSSIEAILHMDNAPADISTAGVVAAPARSLFQTNSVGLRMITPVSWALRAPGAVAWMSGVNW